MFAVGVMLMVAVTGVVPVFTAAKAPMFPFPLAANPIDVVLFDQANDVPNVVLVMLTAFVNAPLQSV